MPGARKNPGGTGKGHRSFAATEARAWRPWRLAFGPRQPAAKEAFQKQREEKEKSQEERPQCRYANPLLCLSAHLVAGGARRKAGEAFG